MGARIRPTLPPEKEALLLPHFCQIGRPPFYALAVFRGSVQSAAAFVFSDTIASMNILTEIYRRPGVNINGKTVYRTAVKGVVLRGRTLLMIHSSKVGDYDFPGGGLHEGETHAQGLHREILEECGMTVAHIGSEIGVVIEYDFPIEPGYDVFKMTLHYYHCEVQDAFVPQKLEDYEQELGFTPVWIDIDDAIRANKALLPSDEVPRWLRRNIFVLDYIQRKILLAPGAY